MTNKNDIQKEMRDTTSAIKEDIDNGGFFYYLWSVLKWIVVDLLGGIICAVFRFLRWVARRKWTPKKALAAVGAIVFLVFFADDILYMPTIRERVIYVNKMEDQSSNQETLGHRYMVHADLDSFKIVDSRVPFYWTFASDVYRDMGEGRKFRVTIAGLRVRWPERWTNYPNILRVIEELPVEKSPKMKEN